MYILYLEMVIMIKLINDGGSQNIFQDQGKSMCRKNEIYDDEKIINQIHRSKII